MVPIVEDTVYFKNGPTDPWARTDLNASPQESWYQNVPWKLLTEGGYEAFEAL